MQTCLGSAKNMQASPLPNNLTRHLSGQMISSEPPSGGLVVLTCKVGSHIGDQRGVEPLEGDGDGLAVSDATVVHSKSSQVPAFCMQLQAGRQNGLDEQQHVDGMNGADLEREGGAWSFWVSAWTSTKVVSMQRGKHKGAAQCLQNGRAVPDLGCRGLESCPWHAAAGWQMAIQ